MREGAYGPFALEPFSVLVKPTSALMRVAR